MPLKPCKTLKPPPFSARLSIVGYSDFSLEVCKNYHKSLICKRPYMQRKIFKTGHSAAVTLSTGLLKDMGLRVGDTVKIELSKDKEEIIIRHGKKVSQLSLGFKLRPKL